MKVEILPSAWACLQEIKMRVREQFGEVVATSVTDRILSSVEILETFPNIGNLTPDPWLNQAGFRMVIADKRNVSIFRRVDDTIYVYYIADTRRHYTLLFRDMLASQGIKM